MSDADAGVVVACISWSFEYGKGTSAAALTRVQIWPAPELCDIETQQATRAVFLW
jgi:hypothetical protein